MREQEIYGYVCPICDTPNPNMVKHCVKCGHWLLDTVYEAKPLTKKEFKKYFSGANQKLSSKKKGVSIIILLLLATIYLLGSTNTKILIGLLVTMVGIICIIKPIYIIGINSRRKGLAILVIGILVLFMGAANSTQSMYISSKKTVSSIDINPSEFKSQSTMITYENLARQTEGHINQKVTIIGEVIQIQEVTNNQIIMLINVTKNQYGFYTDTTWVNYTYKQGENRYLEKDILNVWGIVKGRKTYKSVLNAQITLPEIDAKIIEIARK